MKLTQPMIDALKALGRGEVIAAGPTRKALDRRGLLRFTGESRNAVEITSEGRAVLEAIEQDDRETVIRETMRVTGESRQVVEEALAAMECCAEERDEDPSPDPEMVAAGQRYLEEEKVQAERRGDYTHDFVSMYDGPTCTEMVMHPDGAIRSCGEPVKSAIHDPQAFSAYHAEITEALAEWKSRDVYLTPTTEPQSFRGTFESLRRPATVVTDQELIQLLTLLDQGVTITRKLYDPWMIEGSVFPIDREKLDRTVRAAAFYRLVEVVDGSKGYVLRAEPIHLARTNDETWCGRRIQRASTNRFRYTYRSVPGPKHAPCLRASVQG
jgi:hypothetical protein